MAPEQGPIIRSCRLIKRRIRTLCESKQDLSTITSHQASELVSELNSEFRELRSIFIDSSHLLGDELTEATFDKYDQAVRDMKSILVSVAASGKSTETNLTELTELFRHQRAALEKFATDSKGARTSVKLPELSIPKFGGNSLQWLEFSDLFISTVDRNDDLTATQKFQYLRSLLVDEAAALLSGISITEANYQLAWARLEQRFNRKSLVLKSIIDNFFKCKPGSGNCFSFRDHVSLFSETLALLDSQGDYARTRDPWLIYLMLSRLENDVKSKWADRTKNTPEPSLDEFLNFLNERCLMLDAAESGSSVSVSAERGKRSDVDRGKGRSLNVNNVIQTKCFHCQESHSIFKCTAFLNLSVSAREKIVSNSHRCFNCFNSGHSAKLCKSVNTCRVCKRKHHTLLHRETSNVESVPVESSPNNASILQINSTHCTGDSSILPTVSVIIRDVFGRNVICRALLDCGLMGSLVSEALHKRLGFSRIQSKVPLTHALQNHSSEKTAGAVLLTVVSRINSDRTYHIRAHIVHRLNHLFPQSAPNPSCVDVLKARFQLADPQFHVPSGIDLILGASVVFESLKSDRFFHTESRLIIQDTHFGCVVCDKSETSSPAVCANSISTAIDEPSDELIERFWKIEEPSCSEKTLSSDDVICETIFNQTTTRLANGRFSVRLPFRNSPSLGDSFHIALRRLMYVENRFDHNESYRESYHKFMHDYESLGHMTLTSFTCNNLPKSHYIIPHHGIWQLGPTQERKLRVVFDASSKASNGVSLNELLFSGPPMQSNIVSIIMGFRTFKFVLTADIEKMYRQIEVEPEDRNYQLILWRENKRCKPSIYQLNTVTYGLSCSPYLSLRVVKELVDRDGESFPQASKILSTCRYVDDVFFGANDCDSVICLRDELVELLSKGQFVLKKWASNDTRLLPDLSKEHFAHPLVIGKDDNYSLRTLGIRWNPVKDEFFYYFSLPPPSFMSRRTLLSEAARLYDPLGWISPFIIRYKILIQETWSTKSGWDDELSNDEKKSWTALRSELSDLPKLAIPRYIGGVPIDYHGFCDASKKSYAAAVYVRYHDSSQAVHSRLLISKTKVAPIKPVSIPRLELCAAQLLAKLVHSLNLDLTLFHLWTDSSTVLAWIRSLPRKWNPFVANRVVNIEELCPNVPWRYIRTKENPADLPSRGSRVIDLVSSDLWWRGPKFLSNPVISFRPNESFTTAEELKPLCISTTLISDRFVSQLIAKFSNFRRLISCFAYMHRFIKACKKEKIHDSPLLTVSELTHARTLLVKEVQITHYQTELLALQSETVKVRSAIQSLNPFLDSEGIIRVGGRLQNSNLCPTQRQPILLPRCHFSDLLIDSLHRETFHGGFALLCSAIRREYWVVGLMRTVRKFIRQCPRCKRFQAKTYEPTMGQLPSSRVKQSKPFSHVGLDFAGPFAVTPTRGRGRTAVKSYVAVFVCCAIKAVHLELVPDLSSHSLILALKRFVARRGRCEVIYSDNGRNFVGCNKLIKDFKREIVKIVECEDVKAHLLSSLVRWEFIPPYSPHFGGIWEATVKSMKRHLIRTYGSTRLSIDEFSTVLCQIEAILNSRPLSPIVFSDCQLPITPSLLLNGEVSATFNDTLGSNARQIRISLIQNLTRGFWKKWREEYLYTLMRKPKWKSSGNSPSIGDIVLIKRGDDPPLMWKMGKITNLMAGPDGHIRVVRVSVSGAERTESVRNLVPLVVNE